MKHLQVKRLLEDRTTQKDSGTIVVAHTAKDMLNCVVVVVSPSV